MTHKTRIISLEKKVGTKAPEVLIGFSDEEIAEKVAQFRKDYPYAPLPVLLKPQRIYKEYPQDPDFNKLDNHGEGEK